MKPIVLIVAILVILVGAVLVLGGQVTEQPVQTIETEVEGNAA